MGDLTELARATASSSSVHDSLQLGEFIISRIDLLTEVDLRRCLAAFNQSGDSKTVAALEQQLAASLNQISAATVSDVLYDYAK